MTQKSEIFGARNNLLLSFSRPEETLLKSGCVCGRELLSGPPALRASRTSPETAKYAPPPGIGKLNLRTSSFGSVSTRRVAVFRDLSRPIPRRRFRCEISSAEVERICTTVHIRLKNRPLI